MDNETITLTIEQMRKIARYEYTFEDIIESANSDNFTVICPNIYPITLDDLYHALKRMEEQNSVIGEIGEYWIYLINEFSDSFELDHALTTNNKEFSPLKTSDTDYFRAIWQYLEDAWEDFEYDTPINVVYNFDSFFDWLDSYMSQRDKPIMEREFSDSEMEYYVLSFKDDNFVKKASPSQLELARKFIAILIEKDSEIALRVKGYACYGGDRLYDCDWYASRDCITRLFDLTDDPRYANTLGYIYYYGRCNHGEPEYEKAFQCFEIAAANGIYEGMYKLADMYSHGYGCKKSLKTAKSLYNMVYSDSLKNFQKGQDANFADIAIRKGNLEAEEGDFKEAYFYYLEGAYAAKIRAEKHDYYGSASTAINAQKSLDKAKEKLSQDYFKDYMDDLTLYYFEILTDDNNVCELSKTIDDEGHIKLNATRIPTRSVPDVKNILLVIPELSLCERTTGVTYYLEDSAQVHFIDEKESVRFDYLEWNMVENRYDFLRDERVVAWVKSDTYRIYAKKEAQPDGKDIHIVTIRFSTSGRSYDYICDDISVKEGDAVIVEGYDGETQVEVVGVSIKKESELVLPRERYKKIIRKV